MLAPTAPLIGAATLALAATPGSIGDATSRARLRSALRSRSDMTSLSGSAVPLDMAGNRAYPLISPSKRTGEGESAPRVRWRSGSAGVRGRVVVRRTAEPVAPVGGAGGPDRGLPDEDGRGERVHSGQVDHLVAQEHERLPVV